MCSFKKLELIVKIMNRQNTNMAYTHATSHDHGPQPAYIIMFLSIPFIGCRLLDSSKKKKHRVGGRRVGGGGVGVTLHVCITVYVVQIKLTIPSVCCVHTINCLIFAIQMRPVPPRRECWCIALLVYRVL